MRPRGIAILVPISLALLILVPTPGADMGLAGTATSGEGVWETIGNTSLAAGGWQPPDAGSYRILRLNRTALARELARAPMERTADLRNSPVVLSLPMPDGSFKNFHIEESPVMDAELVALYPEIKSYRGQGIEDGAATVRFDWSPYGFHGLVLSQGQPINILPPKRGDLDIYATFFDAGAAFECGVNDQHKITPGRSDGPNVAVGSTLRTYRLAVAATNEYCVLLGNNTAAGTVASINTFLNGVNAIYERELSVHLNLVNAPTVIYAGDTLNCGGMACNAGNDPYTNGSSLTMLDEVLRDLHAKVGPANYDLGHVLGTNSGGVAFIGVVCENDLCITNPPGACKGAGVSSMTAPAGNAGAVATWTHELGHQFGASHTFNATGNCGGQRVPATAYEPGSGTTIMSYPGSCSPDNISSTRDLRFHAGSFAQMSNFITSGGGAACAASTATGNNPPTVNAGTPFTIPRNTPFTLTATGTDADPGDVPNLTFVWEQIDAGGTLYFNPPYGDQAGDPPTTTRPLFRAFSPTTAKSRTFPSLTYILNNANVPPPTLVGGFQSAESLPSVSRTINFRATVRDNRAGFGGVNDSSMVTTVDGNSGPFAVTAPNGGGTLSGAQNVTWSVNNTNVAPVSCANVKITLSTDGGVTFPIVLAATTANTGTAGVTLPNGIINTTARVKVEALGNIFFDISNGNFTLVPADTCPAVSNISPQAGNTGETVTITGVNFINAGNVTGVRFANNVSATFNVVNDTTITATVPAGAVSGPITISKTACPDIQTVGYNVCPNAPGALIIDDGGTEGGFTSNDGAYYVNRLTPGAYPATLAQISIFWRPSQNFPPGTPINVVAGNNAGGTPNIDGTSFQTFAATAGAQPGFTTFTLPNALTIAAGDFVVGFQVPTGPAGSLPIAIDTNNPISRSYSSNYGSPFVVFTNFNYMIRAAQVFTGCGSGGPTPAPTPTPTATPSATPGLVGNVSTRLPVGTGENVLIEGFIVEGPAGSTKKIIVRALGPSLIPFGIADALANPTLEIRDASNASVATNNDWRTTQVGGLITGAQVAEITASGLQPSLDPESAIIANLVPGSYTAIVRGVGDTVGTGVVDAFDLSATSPARLANIATRGFIQPGDRLMIAGFIIQNGPVRAVIRAVGPSLIAFGVANALPDTTLQLRDQNGAIVLENDDWRTTQEQELINTGLQPTDSLEAALVTTMQPGSYTAQVRGKNNASGVGVVQVYFLQ